MIKAVLRRFSRITTTIYEQNNNEADVSLASNPALRDLRIGWNDNYYGGTTKVAARENWVYLTGLTVLPETGQKIKDYQGCVSACVVRSTGGQRRSMAVTDSKIKAEEGRRDP